MPGIDNSAPGLTHVSLNGIWLRLEDEEFFLPFEQFPWFRKATIEQLSRIERPTAAHLYWPLLDVDLAVGSIRNPAAFPLVSKDVAQPGVGADFAIGLRPLHTP